MRTQKVPGAVVKCKSLCSLQSLHQVAHSLAPATSTPHCKTLVSVKHLAMLSSIKTSAVSGGEASLNKTDGEFLDLMKVTMEEAQNAMLDSIGTQVYGVGTGDDFLGLGAIVDAGTLIPAHTAACLAQRSLCSTRPCHS
jgi:hypothetical protein